MRIKRLLTTLALTVAIGLATSACRVTVERNPDGSLNVESNMTEASLQAEIRAAIADPLVRDLSVELHEGYIAVAGERARVLGDKTDTLTFRLDLGASGGHLTAVVSDAQLNDRPLDAAYVAAWNERIATRLERAGQRNPNSSLQSVTIGGDEVTLVWRVETWRSRNSG